MTIERPALSATRVKAMRVGMAAFGFLVAAAALAHPPHHASKARQEVVAERGADVMPFDLAATTHVFTKTADGGTQRVIAKDPSDTKQITLIRLHMRELRQKFLKRDFSSPTQIHGAAMPGLAALRTAKPGELNIAYREPAAGAELVYRASNPELITAVHEWFDAQLSDHGADATEGHHHHHGM